jgi:hypothetical protein
MSDQPSIFRCMIPIKCRRIQVGGGVLYSEAKSTVDLKCKDGSSMVLKNVLYVPKLGVNLLSARCLYEVGLVRSFNSGKMYFKLNRKTVIKATMENGLYIVNHVSTQYKETAFPRVDYNMNDFNQQQLPMTALSRQSDRLNQSAKDRYLLFHGRFAHLGPKKISKLHTVTTLDQLIKVPKDLKIYEVCAIAKMKNTIPKTLANHMISKLTLIQFDIASPFPTSLQGNRYFLLIIDSYTCKNWVLVLKEKGYAKRALEE